MGLNQADRDVLKTVGTEALLTVGTMGAGTVASLGQRAIRAATIGRRTANTARASRPTKTAMTAD